MGGFDPSRRELLAGAAAAAAALGPAGCRPASTGPGVVESYCRICNATCGLELRTAGRRLASVSGRLESHTNGFVCGNGLALPELLASPRRLLRPLVRRGGGLEPASWAEALGAVASGLEAVRERHGGRAIVVQAGWGLVYTNAMGWVRRLADALGTPSYASASSLCVGSSRLASMVTFGRETRPDLPRAPFALLWGANPLRSRPPLGDLLLRRQSAGMRLVVVDPIRTELARRADLHVAPRPGTDLALALGLLRAVVEAGREDRRAVEEETVGFDELAAAASSASPEWVEATTGVGPDLLGRLVEELTRGEGGCVFKGVAVEQSESGFQTCRAIDCLWAVLGKVNRPGGEIVLTGTGVEAVEAARRLEPAPERPAGPAVGAGRFPLFAELLGEAQGNLLPNAVLEDDPYPVRALLVFGANPLLSAPASAAVRRALEALDLLVVADPVRSETAELAHVVLPVASFLEADDSIVIRSIGEVEPALPPAGEAWPEWKVIFELARAAGLGRYFPWETGREARQAQDARFRATPVDRRPFRTPSGRAELASPRLRELGLSPVPGPSDLRARPPSERFPLLLLTGPREPAFCNSQLRGVPMLEGRAGPPLARACAETARAAGLPRGGEAMLETEAGSLPVTVAVDPDMLPGVVALPHCRAEANANALTSLDRLDPVSGFPNLRALPCRLAPRSREPG